MFLFSLLHHASRWSSSFWNCHFRLYLSVVISFSVPMHCRKLDYYSRLWQPCFCSFSTTCYKMTILKQDSEQVPILPENLPKKECSLRTCNQEDLCNSSNILSSPATFLHGGSQLWDHIQGFFFCLILAWNIFPVLCLLTSLSSFKFWSTLHLFSFCSTQFKCYFFNKGFILLTSQNSLFFPPDSHRSS